jgi:hypothetical protein
LTERVKLLMDGAGMIHLKALTPCIEKDIAIQSRLLRGSARNCWAHIPWFQCHLPLVMAEIDIHTAQSHTGSLSHLLRRRRQSRCGPFHVICTCSCSSYSPVLLQ